MGALSMFSNARPGNSSSAGFRLGSREKNMSFKVQESVGLVKFKVQKSIPYA
jgi:hypothetical protein